MLCLYRVLASSEMRDVSLDTLCAPQLLPLLWLAAQRANLRFHPPDTLPSLAAHSSMPPKDAIWQLYETLKGDDGKLIGYLTNKSNKCVWCSPCLDKYAALKHAAETTNIGCHEPGPSQVRSKAMLRAEGIYPASLSCICVHWYKLVGIQRRNPSLPSLQQIGRRSH